MMMHFSEARALWSKIICETEKSRVAVTLHYQRKQLLFYKMTSFNDKFESQI